MQIKDAYERVNILNSIKEKLIDEAISPRRSVSDTALQKVEKQPAVDEQSDKRFNDQNDELEKVK